MTDDDRESLAPYIDGPSALAEVEAEQRSAMQRLHEWRAHGVLAETEAAREAAIAELYQEKHAYARLQWVHNRILASARLAQRAAEESARLYEAKRKGLGGRDA